MPVLALRFQSLESRQILLVFIFFNLFILFTYFWLCWVFVAACGLSLVAASGGYSWLLIVVASVVAEHRL